MWRGHYQTKKGKCPSSDKEQSTTPQREIEYQRLRQNETTALSSGARRNFVNMTAFPMSFW